MGKNSSLLTSLFALLAVVLVCSSASAQDSGSPSFEAYDRSPLDRVFLTGPNDSITSQSTVKKDSASTLKVFKRNVYKPSSVVPKQSQKQQEQSGDNSILSFNFLYYLIQKYKMQDIVD
jgi:hypothetical protein